MAKQRTTFGKLQRDRDKQAKNRAKLERRAAAREERANPDDVSPDDTGVDQGRLLAQLAQLQEDFGAGRIGDDEFETRRAELSRLLGLG